MITHILNLNTKLLTLQIQYYTAGITIIKYRIKFRPHFKSSFLHGKSRYYLILNKILVSQSTNILTCGFKTKDKRCSIIITRTS